MSTWKEERSLEHSEGDPDWPKYETKHKAPCSRVNYEVDNSIASLVEDLPDVKNIKVALRLFVALGNFLRWRAEGISTLDRIAQARMISRAVNEAGQVSHLINLFGGISLPSQVFSFR